MSTDAPVRIQLRRTKGWRKPDSAVVVSRPSKWGNPFRVVRRDCSLGGVCWCVAQGDQIVTRHLNREHDARTEAVRLFRLARESVEMRARAVAELAGHDLGCWCPLDQPCHADVLLDIANGGAA